MSNWSKNIISNMKFQNIDHDLLDTWFLDLSKKREMYREPFLGIKTVRFLKQICDAFEQNTHVFIMAIEVAEDYILGKKVKKEKIIDPLLASVTIVFMCHKCEGARESLKVKHVLDLMSHFTQKVYKPTQIISMEGDIIVTLRGKLPICTLLDDLDIIMEKYINQTKLKINIRPLCLKLLEYVQMERRVWFKELKDIYSQNKECIVVFHHLITSKVFIPISILIAAIELTQYRDILDIANILADVTKHTKIHEDHVRIMAAKIIENINFM